MKRSMMIAAALLALASWVRAEEPLVMRHKLGVGFDKIAGATPTTPFLSVVDAPNALALRYWLNEKVALELQASASTNTQPSSTTGTAGTASKAFGVGLQGKYVISRPHELLLTQLAAGFSVGSFSQGPEPADKNNPSQTTSTISVWVGTGFEAFLPWWRALSIEGQVRLRVQSTETKTEGGTQQFTQSGSSIGFQGDGFSPLNLSIHYYF